MCVERGGKGRGRYGYKIMYLRVQIFECSYSYSSTFFCVLYLNCFEGNWCSNAEYSTPSLYITIDLNVLTKKKKIEKKSDLIVKDLL